MFLFRKKAASHPAGIRLEIILYHFVSDQRNDFTLSGHTVIPSEFRRQLEYLSSRCTMIRLSDISALNSAETNPTRPRAAVCFDDGYRCILREAYPILRDMRVPATIFINPPVLGNRDLLWRDKIRFLIQKEMEKDFVAFLRKRGGAYRFGQLKGLGFYKWSKYPKALRNMQIQRDVDAFFEAKGFDPAEIASKYELFLEEEDIAQREFLDFGNHTWSHPILTLLPAAAQREEIVRCHEFLRARGITPSGLALPFSPYDNRTLAVCRELGYACILTVYEESNFLSAANQDRPMILHRRMAPKDFAGLVPIV
jgi:peptidoglycan/xylan/chitin deacetylase (PgdA/CDA1 family)